MSIENNKPLSEFTSWKVGGVAEKYSAPKDLIELRKVMEWAHQSQIPISILGGGTNVLVSDEGVPGLLIHTLHLNKVQVLESGKELVVEAEAGTQKSEVLKLFLKYRLAPAVFLAGLPGDMAGGVVMNAGVGHKVSPKEFCEIVREIEVFTFNSQGRLETKIFNHSEIQWAYRKSSHWQPGVITKVKVAWPNQPDDQVLISVREGNKRRKTTQPLSEPSCGSVFKNPEGDYAGRLIEASGLKGFSIGGAQVSEKHANFIVNKGQASAKDIRDLIFHVQKTVNEKQSVILTNEVVFLGKW